MTSALPTVCKGIKEKALRNIKTRKLQKYGSEQFP